MNVLDIARRAEAIERTFAAAFAALIEFRKVAPAEADRIAAAGLATIRNAFPQALRADVESAPFVRVELAKPDPSPIERIERQLKDGTHYEAFREADAVVLTLVDGHGDKTTSAMLPIEWMRMRSDIDGVAATVKP